MWVQAVGIAVIARLEAFAGFAVGAALLGVGTAMVYPTLLAAIGDVAHPSWRASAVGVYRLWRDLGYAIGALLAGVTADRSGLPGAMWIVAALTFVSGLIVACRMSEPLPSASVAQRKGHHPLNRILAGAVIIPAAIALGLWWQNRPSPFEQCMRAHGYEVMKCVDK